MQITLRKISILGFLICAASLISALLIEDQYLVSPCPLCMLQRLVYACLGIILLFGSIFNFKSLFRYIYTTSVILIASLGFGIAYYQFWLQYYAPPQQISCSASLQRLIELHPILDALKIAFTGSPECATVDFTILTISIAGWSVILFGMFIIISVYLLYLQKKRWI